MTLRQLEIGALYSTFLQNRCLECLATVGAVLAEKDFIENLFDHVDGRFLWVSVVPSNIVNSM